MIRKLHENSSYKKLMGFYIGIYLLLSFATVTISYLFLPFTVAMLASLFLFESPKRRIFSFLAPIVALLISAAISLSEIPTASVIVALALILSVCYAKRKSKALCCLYLCSTFIFYLFLIFFFFCASKAGTIDISLVFEEMSKVIADAKIAITDYLYGTMTSMSEISAQPITLGVVEDAVNSIFELWPTIVFVVAFTVSGVSIKFFTHLVARNCRYGILKSFVAFTPTTLVAVFYIVVYILSMLSYGSDVLTLSIAHISNSLMVVFAYLGFKYLKIVSQALRKQRFLLLIAIAVILVSPAFGLALISYVGVHMTVIFNRQQNIR